MSDHVESQVQSQDHAQQEELAPEKMTGGSSAGFADGNPNVAAQLKMQEAVTASPRVQNQMAFQRRVDQSPVVQQRSAIQRSISSASGAIQASGLFGEEETDGEMLPSGPVQRKELQADTTEIAPVQRQGLYQVNPIQRNETTPSVTDGITMDIINNAKSLSTSYAIDVLKKELSSNKTIANLLVSALSYTISSLASLNPWLEAVKKAYDALRLIASIPRGVVAVFLWGIGKLFMWFANKFYNGGRVARMFGNVTEAGLFTILNGVDDTHESIQKFVDYVEYYAQKIAYWLGSGQAEDTPTSTSSTDDDSVEQGTKADFIKFNVETPELAEFTMSGQARAGLNAKASAHLTLLGQTMGGDLDVKLPFGPDWEVGIDNFFKSSAINLPGLKIGDISGDNMTFSNNGLEMLQMSANNITVAKDIVQADKLQVTYRREDNSIEFMGKGSAALWDGERLNGDIRLAMGTDGSFQEARILLDTGGTFSPIPGYLDIVAPHGQVEIFADKAPNLMIRSGIAVKGLPGGVTVNVDGGGVEYKDSKLRGFVQLLDIQIPLGGGAKITLRVTQANFDKEGLTAENAQADFDYVKPKKGDEAEAGVDKGTIFPTGLDLSWINIAGTQLNALSLRAGLTNFSMSGGKFNFDRDETSGLRKLDMRVLGVAAKYDAETGKGSLAGHVSKEFSATPVDVDFPTPIPGVGGNLSIKGLLGFDANLAGELAHDAKRSDKSKTVMGISGEVGAKAYSALKLSVGAFVGVPYLAKITGGVYGQISGSVEGKVGMQGGLVYDKESSRVQRDTKNPVRGDFLLQGQLKASVGAELKAKVLIFEKELARVELGDWILGEYGVHGKMESDEEGKPQFSVDKKKSGFIGGKPTPAKVTKEVLRVDKWIAEAKANKSLLEYSKDADKSIRKVLRDILYGGYSEEQIMQMKTDYIAMLKNESHKRYAAQEYLRMAGEVGDLSKPSFVWTPEIWKEAVKMRKRFFFFEQSKSKKKIYEHLEEYHKLPYDSFEKRLAILNEIKVVMQRYIEERSSDSENKAEAKQLFNQIMLEIEGIKVEKKGTSSTTK